MDERLARRWATKEMVHIWKTTQQYTAERLLWFTILNAQIKRGMVDDPGGEQLERYRVAIPVGRGALSEIDTIERSTRHDLQARLIAYEHAAVPVGCEPAWLLHRGLTSADITENTQAIQIRTSLDWIIRQVEQCMHRLGLLARWHAGDLVAGRTHGVPAQLTTHGARYARAAHELHEAHSRLVDIRGLLPWRGLGGAVGTYADMEIHRPPDSQVGLSVLLSNDVADTYGFTNSSELTGQVGWRSTDLDVASALLQTCAVPANVALNTRLGTMLGVAQEDTAGTNRVGSSAMPHKRNPRYSERICGLQVVARGYHSMIAQTAGNTWFEGDVSDSCVRRVAWPGLFLAVSGLLRSFAYVLEHVKHDRSYAAGEVAVYDLELSTGRLLNAAIRAGGLRGPVHDALREALVDNPSKEVFANRLVADERWPQEVGSAAILDIIGDYDPGLAPAMAAETLDHVKDWVGSDFQDRGDDPI